MFPAVLLIVGMLAATVPAMAQTTADDPPKLATGREAKAPAPADAKLSELRDWLAMPTEKLVTVAQEQGFQALAELRAGRGIGRLETREKNLEQFRIDLLAQAEAADQQRAELLKRVEDEVEQIRQQFGEDQAECANQIRIVIQQHRDAILALKAAAEGCRQLASQTDSHLKAVRPRLLALRRDHRVTAEGQLAASRTVSGAPTVPKIDSSLIATLGSDLESLGLQREVVVNKPVLPTGDKAPRASKAAGSVEQALAELNSLK
jgi:hypothetical protein